MKRNIKWITYILTGSVLATLLAACGPRGHNPEERAEWAVDKATSKLDLDETQVAKLNVLKDAMLSARKDFQRNRESGREAITAMLAKPTLDRDQAMGLVNQHTAAVNAQAPQVIAALGDFYDSLNPEQQNTLREFVDERMQHGKHHWQ